MPSMKDFKVQMLLGKGSYGSVYKVVRKADGLVYAVKEINIKKLNSKEREDAVNEIRILASLDHPNIVRYCEAFVERDNLYIVMEFAEKGDLHRKIKKYKEANRCIKEDVIWKYALQTMTGLAALKKRNVLHRDIKPKNIFLTADDSVKVGDLGCSKVMKNSLARTQIGTPYYMSPELWAKRGYDHKSDMWALGCVLFELCSLRPPFLAKDMTGLAQKVRTAPTPRIPRHYSQDLQSLVHSLLAKKPASRPSVDDVLRSPAAATRLSALAFAGAGVGMESAGPGRMLDTIKIPSNFGRRRLKLDLPEPAYPSSKLCLSPGGVPQPPPSVASSSRSKSPRAGGRGRDPSRPKSPRPSSAANGARYRSRSRSTGVSSRHVPSSVDKLSHKPSSRPSGRLPSERSRSNHHKHRHHGPRKSSAARIPASGMAFPFSGAISKPKGRVLSNAGIAAPYASKPW